MRYPIVRPVIVLFLAGAVAAGCRDARPTGGVSDSTFVDVMARLRRVYDAPGLDSAARAARRQTILQSRGLTAAQLEAAARALAQNPTHAQTVWQAVERRAADTTTAPGTNPAAAAVR